jgi:ABC-type branched-subunit amino acid transport system ATPase component
MNNHARVPDLEIEVGRHLVLVGTNAVGKTTNVRTPERVAAGPKEPAARLVRAGEDLGGHRAAKVGLRGAMPAFKLLELARRRCAVLSDVTEVVTEMPAGTA